MGLGVLGAITDAHMWGVTRHGQTQSRSVSAPAMQVTIKKEKYEQHKRITRKSDSQICTADGYSLSNYIWDVSFFHIKHLALLGLRSRNPFDPFKPDSSLVLLENGEFRSLPAA